MSSENWAEERDRLRALLGEYQAGRITRFDEDGGGSLGAPTTADRIAAIKQRLAALDDRLDRAE